MLALIQTTEFDGLEEAFLDGRFRFEEILDETLAEVEGLGGILDGFFGILHDV